MKKILVFLMLALSFVACTDDFEDDLIDPKNPTSVPAPMLFANAQRNLVDQIWTPNVNSGIFRLISQHWANTTYPEESRYDLVSRNIPQNFWFVMYRDVLMDFREAALVIEADQTLDPAQKAKQLAIIEVMEVYTWSILVNTFGDIPYSEALNPDNVYPKYDNAASIYNDLFSRLDAAIGTLATPAPQTLNIPRSFDLSDFIYRGDGAKWFRFANSLKVRLGMTVADVDANRARTAVTEALPNVFASAADNARFNYTATTPNVNPVWTNLVQSGRNDFVPANTLVDRMNALNDPRRAAYFRPVLDANGNPMMSGNDFLYRGGIYGSSNTWVNFSHVNPNITRPDAPAYLLTYDEIQFYLAEAVARGFIGGTPSVYFREAITANMQLWGVNGAEAYLAQAELKADMEALDAVSSGDLTPRQRQALGVQKWIAMYERSIEAWTEFRRLDYPQLQAPAANFNPYYTSVPVRYPYPPSERTLNPDNVTAASSAIGGDEATNRIFWDVRPAGQ